MKNNSEINLLIFNCGSSSLSYRVFCLDSAGGLQPVAHGKAYHIGVKSDERPYLRHTFPDGTVRRDLDVATHAQAARAVLQYAKESSLAVQAIGHRFVHGGSRFQSAARITPVTLADLQDCSHLAPIHNPNSLSVIQVCLEMLPSAVQYASFDTAFHASLPEKAFRYALPISLADQYGFRKYGFHGLSYQYVCLQVSRFLNRPLETLKIIACHLGTGGSSVVAIQAGKSLDTSMGYSPLPGLIMSTRSGDLDPAIILELIGEHEWSVGQVNRLLNRESGLAGIGGGTSDLFELVQHTEQQDPQARLAVEMYVHRLKSYIGAYLALLGGADALVFTDDIGLRSWQVRQLACEGMEWCGMEIDPAANRNAPVDQIALISRVDSQVSVISMPTDEELMIALEGANLLRGQQTSLSENGLG